LKDRSIFELLEFWRERKVLELLKILRTAAKPKKFANKHDNIVNSLTGFSKLE